MKFLLIVLLLSSFLYAADQKGVKDKDNKRDSLLSNVLALIDQQKENWKLKSIADHERKREVGTAQLAKKLLYLPSFEKPVVETRDKETHLKRSFSTKLGDKSFFVEDDATSGIDDRQRCLIKARSIRVYNWDEKVITLNTKVGRKSIIWSSTATN